MVNISPVAKGQYGLLFVFSILVSTMFGGWRQVSKPDSSLDRVDNKIDVVTLTQDGGRSYVPNRVKYARAGHVLKQFAGQSANMHWVSNLLDSNLMCGVTVAHFGNNRIAPGNLTHCEGLDIGLLSICPPPGRFTCCIFFAQWSERPPGRQKFAYWALAVYHDTVVVIISIFPF